MSLVISTMMTARDMVSLVTPPKKLEGDVKEDGDEEEEEEENKEEEVSDVEEIESDEEGDEDKEKKDESSLGAKVGTMTKLDKDHFARWSRTRITS